MTKATATRQMILQKAFELIYTSGYQATSIDDIIATTKVTKGAFYYHFKTKDEMGVAIIEELLKPIMLNSFIAPLQTSADPVRDIPAMMKHLLLEHPVMQVQYGCPAGNFTQEMTPWNHAFSQSLAGLVTGWKMAIVQCINNGKKAGTLRKNIHPDQVAYFIMAGYWGIRNLGKLYNSKECYVTYLKELKAYMSSLK